MSGMTRYHLVALFVAGLALSGCGRFSQDGGSASDAMRDAGLGGAALNDSDPQSAVRYYRSALARDPEDPDLRRGLAQAYTQAGDLGQARETYTALLQSGDARPPDRLDLVSVLLEMEDTRSATAALATVPPDADPERHALFEAMIADRNGAWDRADIAYARATRVSQTPAEILNNWGVSRLARGATEAAEDTFARAVSADPTLFIANNNLAIARAMRGEYRAPATRLSDTERAMLLNNMGLVAQRRGDSGAARQLFAAALDVHPRHYAAAAERLAALEGASN